MGRCRLLSKGFRKVYSLIYTISAFSLACFAMGATACSSDSGTSANELKASSYTKEFLYNYSQLYYLYINKDLYLGKPEDYIDKLDKEQVKLLVQNGYPWDYHDIYYMYAMMNDAFTYYIDPARSVGLMSTWSTSAPKTDAGFTLDSTVIKQKYVIKQVIKNSPADKAGLKAGDEITEIEGTPITNDIVFQRLSIASEGDTITFTIKRDSTTQTIPVEIESYLTPTVETTFEDSIPIIKIKEFTAYTSNDSGTYAEFVEALHETEKYRTTIIDLRNNGGGDMDHCIPMAQEFLSKNDTAIGVIRALPDTIHKKQVIDTLYFFNKTDGIAKDRYFVFLANEKTASCSELMLASVTTNKKYPVIGTTTYGKGIGQSRFFTPSMSLVSITSMKIIDKQKTTYHKYGIAPDFAISDNDLALEKALALAKDQNYIRVAGYGTVNTGHFAKAAVEPDTMPGFYLLPEEYRRFIW